jgi:hypothetical protein
MYISTDARRVRTDIMYVKKNEREGEWGRGDTEREIPGLSLNACRSDSPLALYQY